MRAMRITLKLNRSPQLSYVLIASLLVAIEPGSASEPPAVAEDFLQFETKIDGRCHNLSEGGKLTVMKNLHPSKTIEFRLIRYFVEVRQRGRATGTAEPGGEGIKIGCSQVGGRPQRWVVERATFIQEENK